MSIDPLTSAQKITDIGFRELHPCDGCGGPLSPRGCAGWKVIEERLALIRGDAGPSIGMALGLRSSALADAMLPPPAGMSGVMVRAFVCYDCLGKPLDEILENASKRQDREREEEEARAKARA